MSLSLDAGAGDASAPCTARGTNGSSSAQQYVQAGSGSGIKHQQSMSTSTPAGSPPPSASPLGSGGFEILDSSAIKKSKSKVLYNQRAYSNFNEEDDDRYDEFKVKRKLEGLAQRASAHTRFMRRQE